MPKLVIVLESRNALVSRQYRATVLVGQYVDPVSDSNAVPEIAFPLWIISPNSYLWHTD